MTTETPGKRPPRRTRKRRRQSPISWPVVGVAAVVLVLGLAVVFAPRGGGAAPNPAPSGGEHGGSQGNSSAPIAAINARAALQVERQKIDLGNVRLGKEVRVTFAVTNTSSQPVKFMQKPYIEVAAGC